MELVIVIRYILLLTLLLTFSSALVLLFRLLCRRQCGNALRVMWLAVLLLAVIPLPATGHLPQVTELPAWDWTAQTLAESLTRWEESREAEKTAALPADTQPDVDIESAKVEAPHHKATFLRYQQAATLAFALILTVWLTVAVILLVKKLTAHQSLCHLLRAMSVPVAESGQTSALFAECQDLVGGMARRATLRVVTGEALPLMPCMCGVFRPVVYVTEAQLLDETMAKCIFVHELTHVRHWDVGYRLLAVLVTCLHWFNPVSHVILPKITEDCELSCDSRVLRTMGENEQVSYMKTLLKVASEGEYFEKSNEALCMCRPDGKKMMKRRYENMTGKKMNIWTRLAAGLLVCLMLLAGVGCADIVGGNSQKGQAADTLSLLTPLTEEMVRYYYDLSPEDTITQEMLNGITSLRLYALDTFQQAVAEPASDSKMPFQNSEDLAKQLGELVDFSVQSVEELAGKTLFDYEINGALATDKKPEDLTGALRVIPKNYFETNILANLSEVLASNQFYLNRFRAYYLRKDAWVLSDSQLNRFIAAHPEEQPFSLGDYRFDGSTDVTDKMYVFPNLLKLPASEQKAIFSDYTSVACSAYIMDPATPASEKASVWMLYQMVGVLQNHLLESTEIDTSVFDVFPNLEQVQLVGLSERQ